MPTKVPLVDVGGYELKYKLGMIGSAAPVFPGFEVDICARVPDDQKPDAVWHRERARAMLRAHPEIKDLFGPVPATALVCLLCAGGHVAIAAAVSHGPWWLVIAAAWVVGAWLNVLLFQLAHECNHGLVFQRTSWNRWLFTFTSLPMFLSGHHTWWVEHLVHHNDLGAKKDFISRRRTFFLLTRYTSPLVMPYSVVMLVMQFLRSLLGVLLYVGCLLRLRTEPGPLTLSVLADEHLASGYRRERITRWAVAYPLLNFALCGLLWAYGGWKPIVYLLLSQAFMTGFLHPFMFGIVLAISHFHGTRNYQPSASYYGWLNHVMLNIGYHVEHHDLAAIPWFRVPQLRRIAPEFYNDLEQIHSYTRLAWRFVFARRETYLQEFSTEAHRNLERFTNDQPAAV
jgi:sphingolipid delta-4 desaturase